MGSEGPPLAGEAQRPQRLLDERRQLRQSLDIPLQTDPDDTQPLPSAKAAQGAQAHVERKGRDDSGGKGVLHRLPLGGGNFTQELEGQMDALGADPAEAARPPRSQLLLHMAQGVPYGRRQLAGDEEPEAAFPVSPRHQAAPRGEGRSRPE